MSSVMEMYEQQMDIVAKARKLEEVSGMSLDVLIQYYTYINNVLKPLSDKLERVNIMTPEEIVAAIEEQASNTEENSMICNRREAIEECLTPYIGKPVYIKGYCWATEFDGWVVLYMDGERMSFDYRGKTYPVWGFLPSRLTLWTDSSINNAVYDGEVKDDGKEVE